MSAALDASPPGGRAAVAARAALASRTSLRAPSRPDAAARPRAGVLRLVPQRRSRAAKTPFVVVVVALLGGGLLGLLLLNTALAQDAFQLHTLKTEGRALAVREQALQRDVESLRTPEALAARAQAMGMVPAGPPAFLRLSDGAVIGAPAPGVAPIEPGREQGPAAAAPDTDAADPSSGEPSRDDKARDDKARDEKASDEKASDEQASDEQASDKKASDSQTPSEDDDQ